MGGKGVEEVREGDSKRMRGERDREFVEHDSGDRGVKK